MLSRGYSGSRGSLDARSTDNRLRADFMTGELAHTLILGAEYHRFRNDLWTGAGNAAPLNPFTGYTPQTGHTITYSDNNNRRYYQTGLYLQDEMVWNRWHLDVSGRYDRIVSQQVSDTSGTSNRRSDDHISGRACCCMRSITAFRPTTAGDYPGDAAGRRWYVIKTYHRRTGGSRPEIPAAGQQRFV